MARASSLSFGVGASLWTLLPWPCSSHECALWCLRAADGGLHGVDQLGGFSDR
ncbi:hypothetical protein PF008_g14151 [Phytophthora fragariae]|uniref:Secreted protein n=1 Tax=Phytophthora fragariae TaxID=53985 RepID=A0A6G0RIR2_9STRA|nr:hypothetical protein PF008_g14151 [Phytophthora fragariae]